MPKPTFEEALQSPNKVKCDCEWPHVLRSGSQACGCVVDIDLCCLVKEVERLSGKKFYHLVETEPAFEWDEDVAGLPPPFMKERMVKKGIKTKQERERGA